MKIVYKILMCLPLIAFLSSCTSDALEVEPTSIITAESFWKTEDDVQGALTGMYALLRNVADEELYFMGEARSEMLVRGTLGTGGWERFYLNTLNSDNAGIDWQQFYTIINAANLVIKYAPDIPFSSESAKNKALAEAYTMRAYVYFAMVRTWGGVPLRTEPMEGFNAEETQLERASAEAVFTLVKEDIDKAVQLFPDNSFPQCRCKWSQPAANSLKGNVYLWTGKVRDGVESDFSTALDALNEVQEANVTLLNDFADVFDPENEGNPEIIMAVKFEEFESGDNYVHDMYINNASISPFIPQRTRDIIGNPGTGLTIVQLAEPVRKEFSEEDARRDATFLEVYQYDNEQQTDSSYVLTIAQKNIGPLTSSGARSFQGDIILYRYADVLLMIAEAKNALGQDPSTEINMVRERAYRDDFDDHVFVSGSKEENDEAILTERLLELALEGKRWWDLIRFGKAFDLVPTLQDRKGEDYLLLFPIPQDVLSLEPRVEQNPGY
jgi:hypothetical protein